MDGLTFEALAPDAARAFLATVAHDLLPIMVPADKTLVQVAALPFYDDYKLYALTDMTLPPPNVRYVLYKEGDLHIMNWTNEPLYEVNEKGPIKLDRKTLVAYARFFFHYVRGQLGRFIIVEKPEEVVWLDNATDKEKADVAAKLMPVTYKGIGRDNLFTLTATVVFKNALFKTDIKVAPYEMDVFDAEAGVPEHFTIGQMKLTNEELLLEELNLPIDPPPSEFG
ncbi:MAG: hypothetical protein WC612_02065 [Bdellovibrionales bacterium]|jgi:hypothetical protein